MPPLTVSRLREVSLAVDAFESRLRGLHHPSSGPLEDVCARFALAVGDVNAALGEVRELLVAGLRDEAVSLHDPELIPIARRLGLWWTLAIFLALEVALAVAIRDNLTLNVVMLLWPIEAVKQWQLSGH